MSRTDATIPLASSVDAVLAGVQPQQEVHEWEMTPTQYAAAQRGEGFDHERYCGDGYGGWRGWIDVAGMGPQPCPLCHRHDALAKFEAELRATGMTAEQAAQTWDDLDLGIDVAFSRCRNYGRRIAEAVQGRKSLYLCGWNGAGKTISAANIGKDALAAGYSVGIFCVADICNAIEDGKKRLDPEMTVYRASELIRKPDVAILDDVGIPRNSKLLEIESDLLSAVVRGRGQQHSPTIYTSNITWDAYREMFGAYIANKARPITVIEFVHGVDFRDDGGDWI